MTEPVLVEYSNGKVPGVCTLNGAYAAQRKAQVFVFFPS